MRPTLTRGEDSPAVPLPGCVSDAIVIGSGFGAAVSAHRLAEAGVTTTVLERGSRWPQSRWRATFASDVVPDGGGFWHRTKHSNYRSTLLGAAGVPYLFDEFGGVFDVVEYDGMEVWRGACVGGDPTPRSIGRSSATNSDTGPPLGDHRRKPPRKRQRCQVRPDPELPQARRRSGRSGLAGWPQRQLRRGYGRLHRHRGLYVMDGAAIPGSTGTVDPSLTITAFAERNIAEIIRAGG